MKLPDDLRRTLSDAADKVMEGGKQLSNQAQLLANVKKLQIEHARRIHELGKQTFAWFESGKMIVSGPVPPKVVSLCDELARLKTQIAETQAKLEAAKLEKGEAKVEEQAQDPAKLPPPVDATNVADSPNATNAPNAPNTSNGIPMPPAPPDAP